MESAKMTLVRLDNTDIIATSGPVLLPGQFSISNLYNGTGGDVTFTSANGSLTFTSDYGGNYSRFFDDFSKLLTDTEGIFYTNKPIIGLTYSPYVNKKGSSITPGYHCFLSEDESSSDLADFNGVYAWDSANNRWYMQ